MTIEKSKVCNAVLLVIATQFVGQAQAQQNAENSMPQAPKAPTVGSLSEPAVATTDAAAGIAPDVGATLEFNLRQSEGQDRNSELRRDTGLAEIQLTLEIEQALSASALLAGRLELSSRRYGDEELNNDDESFAYDVQRLYAQFRPSKTLRLRAGRIGIDDPMESIIDENLDGVQAIFKQGRMELELSHSREDWVEASTAPRMDNIVNTMGAIRFKPNKDSVWMPYVLHRSAASFAGSRPADISWAGVQGFIEPRQSSWRYWLHGIVMDGEEISDEGPVKLGGTAVDLGVNYQLDTRFEPTFTVAFARASGGSANNRFRQSGLHSNDFSLNGENSFRYLGEVLDPELTNIQILTFGAAVQPHKHWRADIALHSYQQTELSNDLRGADIEYSPEALNKALGTGADLVVSFAPNKALDLKATLGSFMPGDAFDNDKDNAWLALLEVDYQF